MRRKLLFALFAALAARFCLPAPAVGSPVPPIPGEATIEDRLDDAIADRSRAEANLESVHARLADLVSEFDLVGRAVQDATRDLVAANRARDDLARRIADAQSQVDLQARRAYQLGPWAPVELLLGVRSPSDLASVHVYAARAVGVAASTVRDLKELRASVAGIAGEVAERREVFLARVARLETLRLRIDADLAEAEALVAAGRKRVRELEAERVEIARKRKELEEAAAEAARSLDDLVGYSNGLDQTELLALLGPKGGKGCEIPPGLVPTGDRIAGLSSYYGWELAGEVTASGAIFDPRLFTAANKELPLGVFLRVHFRGKCAIVLVNDRGPYIPPRILDLSKAAADYLGVRLHDITADVLVPRP